MKNELMDKERGAFEAWYVADAQAQGFPNMTADYMASIREGDGYGDERHMLNGKWDGWQAARATKNTASFEAFESWAASVRLSPAGFTHGRMIWQAAQDAHHEGWQPIETAPLHKRVMVWREDGGVWFAQLTYAHDLDESLDEEDEPAWFSACDRHDGDEAPTHWKPEPAGPAIDHAAK